MNIILFPRFHRNRLDKVPGKCTVDQIMEMRTGGNLVKKREGKMGCVFYGRFLIAISIIAPTTAIAAIIATPTPMTYISVGGSAISGYGDAVGVAASTENAVIAFDGQ